MAGKALTRYEHVFLLSCNAHSNFPAGTIHLCYSLRVDTGYPALFLRRQSGQNVKLTTHLNPSTDGKNDRSCISGPPAYAYTQCVETLWPAQLHALAIKAAHIECFNMLNEEPIYHGLLTLPISCSALPTAYHRLTQSFGLGLRLLPSFDEHLPLARTFEIFSIDDRSSRLVLSDITQYLEGPSSIS
jgi:hypothetical protein